MFLLIPAVIAIPFQAYVFFADDYSAPFIPFYAMMLALWSIIMLEVSLFRWIYLD